MLDKLLGFSRGNKFALLLLLDAILLPLALWSAVMLRLGGVWDPKLTSFWWIFPVLPLWVLPIFVRMGLYRAVLKFVDDRIIYTVFSGVTLSVLLLMGIILMAGITAFPRTAIVIFWVFAMAYIGGSRMLLRGAVRSLDALHQPRRGVIIYGAGRAGVQLMAALQEGHEYRPLAFVDDNPQQWGNTFRGLTVHDPALLPVLLRETAAEAILLAIPSASRGRQRQILEQLEVLQIPIKRLPGMADLVSGQVNEGELRSVELEDLLQRDASQQNEVLLAADTRGKCVLLTGSASDVGRELARQVAAQQPLHLILLEQNEVALQQLMHDLVMHYPTVMVVPVLLRSYEDEVMLSLMRCYQVQTVYHVASFGVSRLAEQNPLGLIAMNVFATDSCAQAAQDAGVATFVLISTDKAVRPTNVMGASKRLAELTLQARHAAGSRTRFVMVRFGNVLGSSGSVVPLFKQQIASGGPVTLTHPDITRYFMTIPEAAQLVIQAGAMGEGGDVFVLDMGEPVKIIDLARRMIHLSGLEVRDEYHPHGDIEIRCTGLRPGEKLYEELLIGDGVLATDHPRIMRAQEYHLPPAQLAGHLAALRSACAALDAPRAFAELQQVVHEFKAAAHTADWVAQAAAGDN
ncbi:polysaccharide biosynthesis protein [Vogesella indigofera]|uniref:polysaccharide biosynthesis protein n=1 Tax=Vogesella indigofera TaxID=45465 RepID=UPI003F42BEF5